MAACLTAHKLGKPETAEPGNPAGSQWDPKQVLILPSHNCHSPQMRLQLKNKTVKQNNDQNIVNAQELLVFLFSVTYAYMCENMGSPLMDTYFES